MQVMELVSHRHAQLPNTVNGPNATLILRVYF